MNSQNKGEAHPYLYILNKSISALDLHIDNDGGNEREEQKGG